jgi:zinc D-Ala-D-Ala carboxypeptidase
MQLSPHFSLAELTVSSWATANGVSNDPSSDQEWANIRFLAQQLEQAREILGNNPILITSAYRSHRVNEAAGGVSSSAHRLALAADFICPAFGNVTQVCHALAGSALVFDQLIWEYGRWVHLGFKAPGLRMRRQLLTKRTGHGYVPGIPN